MRLFMCAFTPRRCCRSELPLTTARLIEFGQFKQWAIPGSLISCLGAVIPGVEPVVLQECHSVGRMSV